MDEEANFERSGQAVLTPTADGRSISALWALVWAAVSIHLLFRTNVVPRRAREPNANRVCRHTAVADVVRR